MIEPQTFVAVGDVIPTRPLPAAWRPFGEARFVFGDLEVALTREGTRWDKPVSYRADPALARQLADAGFGLVSLANNQAMNYGRTGLADTMAALDAAGLPFIGAGRNLESALAPHVFDYGNTKLAVVGLTCVAPRHWDARSDCSGMAVLRPRQAVESDPAWAAEEPGIAPTVHTWLDSDELQRAAKAVARARQIADLVVVAVHWGVGTSHAIAGYQRQLGLALLEAGASIVLGSHPPPLQGFEQTDSGLVSYSLGTFIRQQPRQGLEPALAAIYARMPRETAILELKLDQGHFKEARIHPAMLDSDGIAHPVVGEQARRIIRTILDRSMGLNIGNAPERGSEPEVLTLNLEREPVGSEVRPPRERGSVRAEFSSFRNEDAPQGS